MIIDVKISELRDKIVFSPRNSYDKTFLLKQLQELYPDVKFKTGTGGFIISGKDTFKIPSIINKKDLIFKYTPVVNLFLSNRYRANFYYPGLFDSTKEILSSKLEFINKKYLGDLHDRMILDDHQKVNIAAMTLKNGFGLCVFDEQGAGKTVTFIFAFDILVDRDEIDFVLIIAPKSMVPEWPMDFRKFMDDYYKIETLIGNDKEKRKILNNGADIFVTNFDTAVNMERELTAYLNKFNKRACLVVDESFFIKNMDTKRAQSIKRLREYCSRAYVLCGTPAPNKPQDLVEQFNLVDFGITFADINIPKERSEAIPIVQKQIETKGLFIRHLKSKVLPNLPLKRINRIIIELQPEQGKLYYEVTTNFIKELQNCSDQEFNRNITSFLAKRNALLQICSNPYPLFNTYRGTPAKLLILDELFKDLIDDKDEKIVLWSFYTSSLEAILKRYKKYNPVRYDGKVNKISDRREAIRSFKEDPNTKLFVGNPAAGGAGLNLQNSRIAIYESFSNQAAHYLQSLDRIHRRGQTREVEYIILLSQNTIELDEYDTLLRKEQVAQNVLGDHIELPLTRQVLLNQLLKSFGNLEKENR